MSTVGLDAVGIVNTNRIYWNLSTAALYEEALRRHEGVVSIWGHWLCVPVSTQDGLLTTNSLWKKRRTKNISGGVITGP
jgi:ATP-dependent phosphoenolpyruvate carboxykinase